MKEKNERVRKKEASKKGKMEGRREGGREGGREVQWGFLIYDARKLCFSLVFACHLNGSSSWHQLVSDDLWDPSSRKMKMFYVDCSQIYS